MPDLLYALAQLADGNCREIQCGVVAGGFLKEGSNARVRLIAFASLADDVGADQVRAQPR